MVVNTTDSQCKYRMYVYDFKNLISKYHFYPDHRPHDQRKTFVTEAKRSGVDDNVLKMIVGQRIYK